MNFGDKLQQLRKAKGMSQEQLAEQMDVSRQAVSKWELNASTPEVQNILRLSKIFEVSTDELLCNEGNGKKTAIGAKRPYVETIPIICVGIWVGGLLFSIASWWEWKSIFVAFIGILIQLMGVVLFEISLVAFGKENKAEVARRRRKMYSVAVWLVAPFITIFVYDRFRFLIPFGRPSLIDDAVTGMLYIFICASVTWLLQRQAGKKED